MKRLFAVVLVLVAVGGWGADWSGAALWKSSSSPISYASGCVDGYFETTSDKFPWTEADLQAWGLIVLQVDQMALNRAVDAYYLDPANKNTPPVRAIRYALEAQIAKTKDGPRLLAAMGVNVKAIALR